MLTFYAVSLDFTRGIATAAVDDFIYGNALNRNRKALNRRYSLLARFNNQSATFEGPFLPKVG